MSSRSDKRLLYIELGSGYSTHRFIKRHHSSEPKPSRKSDNQTKPTCLSWSLSIGAASTSSPSRTSKSRKRRSTKARGTNDTETECSETCCRHTEPDRVDSDSPDSLRCLNYVHGWCALTDESVQSVERKRRRRHHHPCRPLQQHVFYQSLYDNLQVQNNCYEHRERCLECGHQGLSKNHDDVGRLLPDLDRLSLANGRGRASPPPAYSEICPRSTDTPFVGDVAEHGYISEYQPLAHELDGHEMVEDWIWH